MNTKLFFAALLCGIMGITTQAQTISFESAEGYNTGAIIGQNGWTGNSIQSNPAQVATGTSSDGARSLRFSGQDTQPDIPFTTAKAVNPTGNVFSISQDIYTNNVDEENGSDFVIVADNIVGNQGSESTPASILYYDYEGGVYAVTAYNYSEEIFEDELVAEFEANTWYTVTATYNLAEGTVTYFIDNEEVYSGALLKTVTEIKQIGYWFDDYSTSYYVDNININAPIGSVKQNFSAGFSVLPNPAVTEVTIANKDNTLIKSIAITDMNGRTVKSLTVNGLAEAKINIADLASGIYMFRIASESGVTTKKVIKQ
ncbi:T9SS type A sorting domain-containing protein [Flavobacterium sp. RHBU_24]|uniref:T9SS type A sorting domain-containing protein n=1 Tax=Flavobacterium sp. RHBU_24 TaxID=3391185 RepID=UPI0039848311